MSQNVMDFANSWVKDNVDTGVYDPAKETVDGYVAKLIADAQAAGITQAQLEDEFGDLSDFIADELEAAADDAVYGLAGDDD